MKYILLLLVFTLSAFAGDSGVYYDTSRDGEGINLVRNNNTYLFTFFTYGADNGCSENRPTVGPFIQEQDCELNGQRWFMSSGDMINELTGEVTGFLYQPWGVNYPIGIPDNTNPFIDTVGAAQIIGIYILRREDDGWLMVVSPFGNILSPSDWLYSKVFRFTTPLFIAAD